MKVNGKASPVVNRFRRTSRAWEAVPTEFRQEIYKEKYITLQTEDVTELKAECHPTHF